MSKLKRLDMKSIALICLFFSSLLVMSTTNAKKYLLNEREDTSTLSISDAYTTEIAQDSYATNVVGEFESEQAPAEEHRFRSDLMYKFMVAEFARHNKLYSLSAEALVELLREVESVDLAEMAADAANMARRLDLATEAAKIWFRLAPDSIKARFVYLTVVLRNNEFDTARPIVTEFLQGDYGDPEKKLQYLYELVRDAGNKKEAYHFFSQMTATLEPSKSKWLMLGQLAWMADLPRSAVDHAESALGLDPNAEDAAILKASALRKIDPASSITYLSEFLEKHPDANTARSSIVGDLIREARYEEVIPHLQELIRDDPGAANVRFTLALVLFELGRYEESKERIHTALSLGYEDRGAAYFRLGLIDDKLDMADTALNWFLSVPKGDNFVEAQSNIADLKLRLEGRDATISYLQVKLEENPEYYAVFIELQARIYRQTESFGEYFEVLDNALLTMPDEPSLLYSSAIAAETIDRFDIFEERLRRLMELQPNNPQVYNALGYTLADSTDRYEEAKTLLSRALELAPDDPTIIDSMGWVEFKLEDYETSLALLERAYQLERHPEIAAHLGEVLWVLGREVDAKSIWSEALSVHPGNEVLLDTLGRHGVD